ncbi:MAG TPA: glycosyltransferase [Chitinophagaceae bacterium]|nr:glycosyltransferase [Chitinophagaceae bacterium]
MNPLLWKIDWGLVVFCVFALVTVVQLFYHWWFFRRISFFNPPQKAKSQTHPVSVIVCARDEAANLVKNLPGVLVQTYPTTHEVIVVNDNSVDESKYVIAELQKTFKNLQHVPLTHEAKGIPGKKYPLSIGIKEAKHEIVLLTDADCVPATEFWIQKMQDAYDDGIEVVIGYGAYHKKQGMLNKLIRFETFQSALQFLSFALAGIPYMGVGRNLSYKKGLFFKVKGFSSMNHIPSGDDDLFINKVANKRNTAIVIDKDATILSEPKKTFGDWFRQKTRHFSTARFYKPLHKFLLGLYTLSQFLFYPAFIGSLLLYDWRFAAGVFVLRMISYFTIYTKALKKLDETDLTAWLLLLDIWQFFYYIIFAPALWKKPRKTWN